MALSDKKAVSNARHVAKLDSIRLQPKKEKGNTIRLAAEASGMSLQGFILQAIDEKIQREMPELFLTEEL